MKRILFIFIIMLTIVQSIFCQDNEEKKWTLQTSPLLWLFSDIYSDDTNGMLFIMDLEYQYKISSSSNISFTLSFLYNNHTLSWNDYDSANDKYEFYSYDETYFQIGFKPMYIHRPFDTGLKGFFVGIYPNFGFRYGTTDKNTKYYTELGFGLSLGYKWILGNGFTMQIGGGVGRTFSFPQKPNLYNYTNFVNSDGRITLKNSDITLLDFKIGYSF